MAGEQPARAHGPSGGRAVAGPRPGWARAPLVRERTSSRARARGQVRLAKDHMAKLMAVHDKEVLAWAARTHAAAAALAERDRECAGLRADVEARGRHIALLQQQVEAPPGARRPAREDSDDALARDGSRVKSVVSR